MRPIRDILKQWWLLGHTSFIGHLDRWGCLHKDTTGIEYILDRSSLELSTYLGVMLSKQYVISTKKLKHGTCIKLERRDSESWAYKTAEGAILHFCTKGLRQCFGFVPKEIWYVPADLRITKVKLEDDNSVHHYDEERGEWASWGYPNSVRAWETNGISLDKTYLVSNYPMDGSASISTCGTEIGYQVYRNGNGYALYFCRRSMEVIFGTAPQTIYFKEVTNGN